jgi:hypothetical protein
MKTYDNHGRLINEMNTAITSDGKTVTTNTNYNPDNGRVITQNISVRDKQGRVTVENIIGGKLLP